MPMFIFLLLVIVALVVLAVLWLAGVVFFALAGVLIKLLLIGALVLIVVRLWQGRRVW